MEAKAKSITFLADEGAIQIPFFQRGYVWSKLNWEDMLFDLLEFNKSHFLGSLILKQLPAKTGEQKEVLIIDGQQRLTTLSILLKVLYDLFENDIKSDTQSELLKYLFYKRYATDKKHLIKINHSRVDSAYFRDVIGNVEQGKLTSLPSDALEQINEASNKILQCYKYFYTELSFKTDDERIMLFNHLLNSENKILVLIDLSEKDNEQLIFDTINSAGVRLSGTDIVKNALFQRAMELLDKADVVDYYVKYWESIFSINDEAVEFWSAQKSTGRLMRDNSELLLQTIAIIKGIFDPEKHTLSELPDLYKAYIFKTNRDEVVAFIKTIYEYAVIYKKFIPSYDSSALFSFDDHIQRLFHILDVCEISTFHPYIIHIIKEYGNDENCLKSKMESLEKFVVKRMIIKQEIKSYNKLCKEFIENEQLVDKKANEISFSEIGFGIKGISNKNATLLLFWIELYRRAVDQKQSVKELKYNYSLEHIMPQKWEEYWLTIPVLDDNQQLIENTEQAKIFRYSKIYSIGNMTLLNSRLNTSLRNYEFEKKIEGDNRKKGIRKYSELWITKDDILGPYDNGQKVWNEFSITKREAKLLGEIEDIWGK